MRWGVDAGIQRKVRCGVFGKSRTGGLLRVPEKYFGVNARKNFEKNSENIFRENPGKNFWQNCFGKNPVKRIIS